ncbi:uncharacterized protein Bfra_010826 [Botrytis fragariae]|uniref:Retrotransposon gag domain-containing protein n=1 Tax=Botrytis fragariae TaxID=1964551 RepID=A0A8H6ALL4_9HELO|nr:uncharacterized protein Bfra_010826 [Botrytis fragariae]KAF5869629.1 hypothetical protein Bfra_010826 [Botrytis fragariae]
MADTSRPSSTTPVDVSTPEGLRKHIRTVFADWPLLSNELSKIADEDLRDPFLVSQLPGEAQVYFGYMCNTINDSLGAYHDIQVNFDAELQNEIAARQTLECRPQKQAQLIAKLQLQLSQLPDSTAEPRHLYQRRQACQPPKPFKAETASALTLRDEYCAWKQDLRIFWAVDSTAFDNERTKLLHMVSLLKGNARQEQRQDIDDIIQDKSAYTAAELFFKKLDSLYIPDEREREAALQFDKLRMKEKQDFSAFYTQLEYLGNACYKSPRGMVLAMKQKVTDELQLMIMTDVNPCANDDLDGWRKKFQIWYQNCREHKYYNTSPTTSVYPRPSVAPAPVNPTSPNDAIRLNAFRTQNREQQRQRELRLGLCHYCKKSGHSVWNCESKKQADAQRSARGYIPGFQGGGYNQVSGRGNFQSSTRRDY